MNAVVPYPSHRHENIADDVSSSCLFTIPSKDDLPFFSLLHHLDTSLDEQRSHIYRHPISFVESTLRDQGIAHSTPTPLTFPRPEITIAPTLSSPLTFHPSLPSQHPVNMADVSSRITTNLVVDDFDPLVGYSNYNDWQTANPQDHPDWWNASSQVTGSPWHQGELHLQFSCVRYFRLTLLSYIPLYDGPRCSSYFQLYW